MGLKISRKDLEAEINSIVGKKRARLTWCMYDSVDEEGVDDMGPGWEERYDNEMLELEFDSFDEIFHEGRVLFKHCGYWTDAKFVRKTNPTWRDVIVTAEKFASGDHIFLESICGPKIGEDGIMEFSLGYGS